LLDEEQAVLPGDQDKLQRLLTELDTLAQEVTSQQVSLKDKIKVLNVSKPYYKGIL